MFCINSIKSYMKKISQKNYSCEKCSVTLQSKDKNKKHYPFCIKLKIEGMTSPKCKECIENTFNQIEGYFWFVYKATSPARKYYSTDEICWVSHIRNANNGVKFILN